MWATELICAAGTWLLREFGEFWYVFSASTQQNGTRLEIGCGAGFVGERDWIELSLSPPAGTLPQERFTVLCAVNGKKVAASQNVNGGVGETSIVSTGEAGSYGIGEELAEAMAAAWKGEITITFHDGWAAPFGPAVFTQTLAFDEDEIGGASEMILAACGLR